MTTITQPDNTPRMWQRACQSCGTSQVTDEWNAGEPYAYGACDNCAADQWEPWQDSDEPHPAAWQ